MKFYRLEKENYFKYWTYAIFKSIGISLVLCVVLMLCLGYKFLIVSSGSMRPTLPVGSLVIMTPCDYDDIELDDIITMNLGGTYLTHRVAGKKAVELVNHKEVLVKVEEGDPRYEDAYWYTQGDYWNASEDPIDQAQRVIGKVHESHCFTFTGEIVMYVQANYKLVIALGVILIVFVYVINYLKSKLEPNDVECYDSEDGE